MTAESNSAPTPATATRPQADVAARRRYGRWYTPSHVADLALRLALQTSTGEDLRAAAHPRIVDPCCGDGAFLTRARAHGFPASALYGADLDESALATARAHLPAATLRYGDSFESEILPDCSFDAVVGNPPYVRQERLSLARKQHIRQALHRSLTAAGRPAAARDLDQLVGRGDLAAACVVRAATLARPGARISLVVSSALLSAGYARAMWRALAGLAQVLAIVDAPRERWFADAAVNAIILVMERRPPPPTGAGETEPAAQPVVSVARLRAPTAQVAPRVTTLNDLTSVADVRCAPVEAPERWPAYMRAPQVYFRFERRAGARLATLGQLADIRRGVTSGANNFFYLSRARARALGLEPEVLVPLLRSPRAHQTIEVTPDTCEELALVIPRQGLERYPAAARYVASHGDRSQRSSLRARKPWWSLPVRPARLFFTKAYNQRFAQHLATSDLVADQRVYCLYPRAGLEAQLLAAILNTTFTALTIESLGRASMGEGALEWTVGDVKRLPVLDPRQLAHDRKEQIIRAFDAMSKRPMEIIARERCATDRRDLDRAAGAGPGELAELLPDIWPALVQTVIERTGRPGRPGRPGRTRPKTGPEARAPESTERDSKA